MHSSHDESLIHVTPCQSFEFTEDFSFPEQAMFIQVIVPLGGANETHRSQCKLRTDSGLFVTGGSRQLLRQQFRNTPDQQSIFHRRPERHVRGRRQQYGCVVSGSLLIAPLLASSCHLDDSMAP